MDPTENVRREMVAAINLEPGTRAALEAAYGQVWNTEELQQDFAVVSFLAPYAIVRRKLDGVRGTLTFQHLPRFYFDFVPT